MLNVASTESFAVVRDQFFKSYLSNAVAQGPNTPYPKIPIAQQGPQPAEGSEEDGPSLNQKMYPPEHIQTPWEKAARHFAGMMPGISKYYAGSGWSDSNDRYEQVLAQLQKPGTPYEKVGHVLSWFKEWRSAQRKIHKRHPNDGYDTQHDKLQDAMTQLLLDTSYAMIADSGHAPAQALHILRSQPKSAVCNDPTPALDKPTSGHHYATYHGGHYATYHGGKRQEAREKWRQDWLARSQTYKEQLEHASPWTIAIDFSWKRTLCFAEGSTVKTKTVPPIYTLAKYLLVADESTWSREHVCDALVMEKTFGAFGAEAQSGLDIGLPARPGMDVSAYEAWWKEQERSSAKDWRYIRRSSVMMTRNTKLDSITVGDAVARLKKFGPAEVVNGAFIYEDNDIKALLLERIQPELGKQYATLKQVEEAMGSMPDVIIESLNATLNKNKKAHAEQELDMGSLFG